MTALVAGALIALIGANIYLFVQVSDLRTELANVSKNISSQTAELGNLRDTSSVSAAAAAKRLETLKADLETAREQARTLSSEAKAEATARAEQLTKQLAEEQARQQQAVRTEISSVRQSADTANAKVADVSTDVGNVKTQVATTNAELQKTIADLKSVRGDLGVQSGLIATNSTELGALRRLGERNYTEFRLGKAKQRQKVGDIQLLLKSVDVKKNKYTVEVLADDKVTEKKDKSINEPVQFYTSKARQPYELVVNQVAKDLIVGYVSAPKETIGR